jgi:hypothetical protein
VFSHVTKTARGSYATTRTPDRRHLEDISLGLRQPPSMMKTLEAGGFRCGNDDGDRTSAIGDRERLALAHASKCLARVLLEETDPHGGHVRQCSTSRPSHNVSRLGSRVTTQRRQARI